MSLPRVLLLRGHSANPWDLRPWELLRDRYEVRLLVSGANAFDVSGLDLPVERIGSVRERLPKGRAGDLATLAVGDRYLRLADALRGADLVHAAEIGVPYSHGPAMLRDELGFSLVLTVWETIPFGDAYRRFRGRRYRRETIPRVDLFLAATERARLALLLEGAAAERVEVAPPGVDTARFRPGDPPAEHLVLSVGRLVWEKGHQDLLRALALLREGGRSCRTLVVGTGPEEERLHRYARDLGVADLVEWRRHVDYDEMPGVFARASCFVLASLATVWWEEQFGMVLAEAAAAGVPIVAAASGAIPEVLRGAGSTFPAGDWVALAAELERVLDRPPARERPQALAEAYSTEAAAGRLQASYDRLLSSR
ncbi:MAG TPA: glycosyltransferase family 4 protein [Gaiellaceae bacterium]|nr:glycosyltransferase family 4 protein [Gaiellaceae bacterium]